MTDDAEGRSPLKHAFAAASSNDDAVIVGRPQWWDLAKIHQADGTRPPAVLAQHLEDSDFFLVRFACSFKPAPTSIVTGADFKVTLQASSDAAEAPQLEPLAVDLHPLDISQERKRGLKVSIAPSLTFNEVIASGGEATYEIEYAEVLPAITAFGALTPTFGWQLARTPNHPIVGVRFFHAIIRRPHGLGELTLTIGIEAEVETPRGIFRKPARAPASGALTVTLG